MKKTISILLVLVLAGASLFAMVAAAPEQGEQTDPVAIQLETRVKQISAFGLSKVALEASDFLSVKKFTSAIKPEIKQNIEMLDLDKFVDVGFLSGINNTRGKIALYVTVSDLVSRNDNNRVSLDVRPDQKHIPAAANNAFGVLDNVVIKVKELVDGSAALAPAGLYTGTITISLTTVQ